jgi:hypothetical protein
MITAKDKRLSCAEPEELKQSELEALDEEIEGALSNEVRIKF